MVYTKKQLKKRRLVSAYLWLPGRRARYRWEPLARDLARHASGGRIVVTFDPPRGVPRNDHRSHYLVARTTARGPRRDVKFFHPLLHWTEDFAFKERSGKMHLVDHGVAFMSEERLHFCAVPAGA